MLEVPLLNYETYYDEVTTVENEGLPIYVFKNVRINPHLKDKKHYEMPGYWMGISDGGRQYGHYLKEYVGGYVYCQSIFKDLKPFFIEPHSGKDVYGSHPLSHIINFCNEKIMNDFGDQRVYLYGNEIHETSFFIENLVIMMDNQKLLFNLQFPFFSEHHCPQVSKALAKYFGEYKVTDESMPKKIFMSRKNVSEDLKKQNLHVHNYFKMRYFDEWIEDAIEQAFIDKGYYIVTWSGMLLQDQIKVAHNATHMAGITGTSFHNAIWSQNGTKIYAVRPNNVYMFDWEHDIVNSLEDISYNYIDTWDCKSYEEIYDLVFNSINDES
jgi:hypothetical protein